jgi:molybdopterin/thiamine biosynthesis adenylyltransferase
MKLESLDKNNTTDEIFRYDQAFSRNIGWLTEKEQESLRHKRVAIAGLGGIGGWHVLALARLGVSHFHLADFDSFAQENFNRQVGSTLSTVGQSKIDVMSKMIRDINPEAELKVFENGINKENSEEFLDGIDIYVDAIDFFCIEVRMQLHAICREKRIPAVIAVPLGMGAAVMTFLPEGMSFEDYFQWEGQTDIERSLRFLVGTSPMLPQRTYLVDDTRVSLSEKRGPSTCTACLIGSGAAMTEVIKILLGRGKVLCAPRGYQFDAYKIKLIKTWRPGGVSNPLIKLMLAIARSRLKIKPGKPG